MSVFTYETEVKSMVDPSRLFKAFVLDHDFIPNILPGSVKSVEFIRGDGGVGSIKFITFGEGSQYPYVKERIDVLDNENFTYVYTVIEGEELMGGKLEKISHEMKFEACPNGDTMWKNIRKFYVNGNVGDGHEIIKEEQLKAINDHWRLKATEMFKAVESYILANPHD